MITFCNYKKLCTVESRLSTLVYLYPQLSGMMSGKF